jgi:hypothetical protein
MSGHGSERQSAGEIACRWAPDEKNKNNKDKKRIECEKSQINKLEKKKI